MCVIIFFFFKQKTAYDMRISDWSSDVCSSDLDLIPFEKIHIEGNFLFNPAHLHGCARVPDHGQRCGSQLGNSGTFKSVICSPAAEIGRASCRERVWQ